MSKTQAALQRRLGRLSMLVDLCEQQLGAQNAELVNAMKKEIALIKEISMRMVEIPLPSDRKEVSDSERPPVTSRRP